jgi:sugar/nucleoside kinase (ribokinase family)
MLKQGNTLGVKQHRIVGVGLSVVDIFSSVDENFLRKLAFDKGTTNPVSPDIFARVLRSLSNPRVEGGGQIANTLRLLSQLGHPCSFLTRVNRDTEAGNFFVESIEKLGIQLIPPADPSLREPLHCILLVTPDGESTQISLLPNVTAMTMDDVDLIPPASLMYLDGYLLNNIENSEVLFASVKRAVSIGTRHIAFNTSNITWVQEFVQEFQELITSGVSILIGTESEIRCLFAPDFSVNCDELVSLVRCYNEREQRSDRNTERRGR